MATRPCGTRAKYVFEHCRCPDCRRANADYQRRRSRAARRPDEQLEAAHVPADETRYQLRALQDSGSGLRSLAAATGLSRKTLALIRSGRQERVSRTTAERVLALAPGHPCQPPFSVKGLKPDDAFAATLKAAWGHAVAENRPEPSAVRHPGSPAQE